jgi:membrane protease YdiL (CAAX protease family)
VLVPSDTPPTADVASPRSPEPPATTSGTPGAPARASVRGGDRIASLIEVVLCSGFPTQLLVVAGLAAAGLAPLASDGGLSLRFVTALSLADTVLLLGLIAFFLVVRGDDPVRLFLGSRRVSRESALGLLLVPVVLLAVAGLMLTIQSLAPWLRNVEENPLASLLRNGRDVAIFGFVAVVAGGAREEVQRVFVLDRFERHLGGASVGLVLFSVTFGLGHLLQGYDAAIVTGILGFAWGLLYLGRRSVVAPLVCHAGFNLAEVLHYAWLSPS